MRKRSLLLVAGACLAALSLAVGSAVADPSGPPTFRALAGGGADGPENVMNALSDLITIGGTKVIGSYNVSGSANITTKDPATNPACTIPRPGNGGQGINALIASRNANDGCLQFARQVTDDSASRAGAELTYIPYARDALSFVIRDDSSLPRNLTVAALFSIYNCDVPGINPLLGSFGAGTRRLFLTSIGHTDTANFTTLHPCVTDGVTENRGNQLANANQIAPHSVAQFLSQSNAVTPDNTGRAKLGRINGISAAIVNNAVTIPRDIFTVVPNTFVATEPTNTVFVGPSSRVCQSSATIQQFSFGTHPNCGSTAITTPPN